jgi:hypothetical protein
MRTKEQIAAENKRLKAEYGNLFDRVTEILFRHDPIGINCEDNLGGHLKTGHTWSLQNRPMERGRD